MRGFLADGHSRLLPVTHLPDMKKPAPGRGSIRLPDVRG
ncbi:hypothetical protein D516_1599 [Rhodobacter sp. AKP1]|nr:hypothetical protein D516_1599 [Rhodobacter sp. AKP1]